MPTCPACKTNYPKGEQFCSKDGSSLLPNDPGDAYLGKQIGNYRIESKLGEGGMGVVYKAFHPSLGRYAAIKFLRPAFTKDSDVVGRFFDEARAVNKINHRNILDVFDLGRTEEGTAYLIGEFLDGEDLEQRLQKKGKLNTHEVQSIFLQVCDALSAAHKAGIVHRDLKPENIFLCREKGKDDFVKLVDFGIAKLLDPEGGGRTSTGIVMGTPHYMSPEQAAGDKNIDQRTDLYSLGVILYQCLSGSIPFRADSASQIMMKHITEEPVPLRKFVPQRNIPPKLDAIVMRLLQKEKDKRFPDANSLQTALKDPEILGKERKDNKQTLERAKTLPTAEVPNDKGPTLPNRTGVPVFRETSTSSGLSQKKDKKFLLAGILSSVVALGAIIFMVVWALSVSKKNVPPTNNTTEVASSTPLFPEKPAEKIPPTSGAVKPAPTVEIDPTLPEECKTFIEKSCDCEAIRDPNCATVPKLLEDAKKQFKEKGIKSKKKINQLLKETCERSLPKIEEIRVKFQCDK